MSVLTVTGKLDLNYTLNEPLTLSTQTFNDLVGLLVAPRIAARGFAERAQARGADRSRPLDARVPLEKPVLLGEMGDAAQDYFARRYS